MKLRVAGSEGLLRKSGLFKQKLNVLTGGIHFRVVLLVTGLAASLMAAQLITDSIVETRKTQARSLAEAISLTNFVARGVESQFDKEDHHRVEEILASVLKRENVTHVLVIDHSQSIFLDGDPSTSPFETRRAELEQLKVLKSGNRQHTMDGDIVTVVEPLKRHGQLVGSILLRFDYPDFVTVALPIVITNLSYSLPILLLGALLSTLLVRQITGPLKHLSQSATAVAAGDLDVRVPIDGPMELRQLGQAFSLMIAKLKKNIEQVYELAFMDKTTRLPNREFFRKELTRAIRSSVRQQKTGALLFVDLDGFKRVNDTHGHDIGDTLLGLFSERLANVLRSDDLIAFDALNVMAEAEEDDQVLEAKNRKMLARLGGDEFTVLLSEIRDPTDAATISERVIKAVSEPFQINGSEIRIGASVGIAIYPRDGSDYQTILKSADMAMYQAKEEGKNTFRYFSEELNQEASRRMMIERDLRYALEKGDQLELFYQPKIDIRSGRPKAVEALIRWNHPEKGTIQPLEFISIAEDCGLILPLGKWILEEACKQINRFDKRDVDLSIAVNISTAQFSGTDLSKVVKETLMETGARPEKLELELTESMAMQNSELALLHITQLKEIGVRFAIDDFGTGYSNLSQLSQIPFDVFKIDRSFVDMLTNEHSEHGQAIVRTILAMANSLNYETVAEGVETADQLALLTEFGCTFAQGYYFARPMPELEFLEWYRDFLPEKHPSDSKQSVSGFAA